VAVRRIYLDYAATAPLQPAARAAMEPWLTEGFGNPSSLHAEGRAAKDAIDVAREQVSSALRCEFGEVIFTSGGTEAINLALIGTALAASGGSRSRILLGATEHHAVLHTEPLLAALGFHVEVVGVDRYGRVDLDRLEGKLADDVLLVSVMFANNELGTWQPVERIRGMTSAYGALFFCDAVQAFGLPEPGGNRWSVGSLGADLVSVSAHKVGGPKGTGALYVRAGTRIKPLLPGGGQEREMRSGTENVAGIAGFGAAAARRGNEGGRELARDAFESWIGGRAERSVPSDIPTLPGILHLRVPGVLAETILIRLDRAGVSASSGAACSSGSIEPSHVLAACGYSAAEAKEGLRFSFGDTTTVDDAEEAGTRFSEIVDDLRVDRAR